MAKTNILDILKYRNMDPAEFDFFNMSIPPMYYFLSQYDIDRLRSIATSVKLSAKIKQKYKMIDDIMISRGFKKFGAGTNRVVYSYYEDPSFVVKIAVDKVGMQDNPAEFSNQFLLQPYVAKTFYISSCGTVGFAERLLPIKNKEEFREIASDVFELLTSKILGKYVMDDIGTKFFANYGIRKGFGPCILDYTTIYKLDGKKLYCTAPDPVTGIGMCDGEIDYDSGFNYLICTKCGKRYYSTDLSDDSDSNKSIIVRGGNLMKVDVYKNGQLFIEGQAADEFMEKTNFRKKEQKPLIIELVNEEVDPKLPPNVKRGPNGKFVSTKHKTSDTNTTATNKNMPKEKSNETVSDISSENNNSTNNSINISVSSEINETISTINTIEESVLSKEETTENGLVVEAEMSNPESTIDTINRMIENSQEDYDDYYDNKSNRKYSNDRISTKSNSRKRDNKKKDRKYSSKFIDEDDDE